MSGEAPDRESTITGIRRRLQKPSVPIRTAITASPVGPEQRHLPVSGVEPLSADLEEKVRVALQSDRLDGLCRLQLLRRCRRLVWIPLNRGTEATAEWSNPNKLQHTAQKQQSTGNCWCRQRAQTPEVQFVAVSRGNHKSRLLETDSRNAPDQFPVGRSSPRCPLESTRNSRRIPARETAAEPTLPRREKLGYANTVRMTGSLCWTEEYWPKTSSLCDSMYKDA